jgi:hypothetical protein
MSSSEFDCVGRVPILPVLAGMGIVPHVRVSVRHRLLDVPNRNTCTGKTVAERNRRDTDVENYLTLSAASTLARRLLIQ